MTEAAHQARYRTGLHVHHRSPYRLTLDNRTSNLIALCIPCHGREEAATHRRLSPEDFAAMRARSDRDRSLGLHVDDYARVYDTCPQCGARKAKKSALCRHCRSAAQLASSTAVRCPVCGGRKASTVAARCWSCYLRSRRPL